MLSFLFVCDIMKLHLTQPGENTMAKLNPKAKTPPAVLHPLATATTYGGGKSTPTNAVEMLRRSVNSCLLFEDEFYESGENIADRIKKLTHSVPIAAALDVATEAKNSGIRHAPLWVARHILNHPNIKNGAGQDLAANIASLIRRPDEIADFLALYWRDGRTPISGTLKKALAASFNRFNEYQFAKYNRDNKIKLKDVMSMVHPNPKDVAQADIFKRIMKDELAVPETWEVRLSSGEDKRTVFEDLIEKKKLGSLALIRNLRNMEQAGVPQLKVRQAIAEADFSKIFPFQVIQAAKQCPSYSDALETSLFRAISDLPKLDGTTVIVIDISGSMRGGMSDKSNMTRMDGALALASMVKARCEHSRVFVSAGNDSNRTHATKEIFENQFGLGKLDVAKYHREIGGGGIFLVQTLNWIAKAIGDNPVNRVVVLTDEQDCDLHQKAVEAKKIGVRSNWIMNVASSSSGIAYGDGWNHINGFSTNCAEFLVRSESR